MILRVDITCVQKPCNISVHSLELINSRVATSSMLFFKNTCSHTTRQHKSVEYSQFQLHLNILLIPFCWFQILFCFRGRGTTKLAVTEIIKKWKLVEQTVGCHGELGVPSTEDSNEATRTTRSPTPNPATDYSSGM